MRIRIRRIGAILAIAAVAVVCLLSISFAIPIKVWRIGESPASPLPVVEGEPAVVVSKRIWIDTDAACGHGRTTDPDDCFALLLLARARDWLSFWEKDIGRNGFYPFDVLATAYTLRQDLFSCASPQAWVARDQQLWGRLYSPEALLVGLDGERKSDVKATGPVLYCPQSDSRLHDWIVARLAGAG